VNPVAFWLFGMGLLQLGMAIVRLLVGVKPAHPEVLDSAVLATAISVLGFAVHWVTARGLRSTAPRRRDLSRVVAAFLILGWVSMTLVTLHASNFPEGEDDPPPGGVRFSAGYNAIGAAWRGIAWPRVLSHLRDLDLPWAPWPAPQVLAGVAVVGLGAWMIGWLVASRPPPVVAPRGDGEPASELRRRLAAFRAQTLVTTPTLWLARLLACHLALNAVLTIVALIAHANSALAHRA
jgi:hypothetical protein